MLLKTGLNSTVLLTLIRIFNNVEQHCLAESGVAMLNNVVSNYEQCASISFKPVRHTVGLRPYSESSLTLTLNEWRFNQSFA